MADRLLDSDVLIDALNGRPDATAALDRLGLAGLLATSAVSLYELDCGAHTPEARQAVRQLLTGIDVLSFDAQCAAEAARLDRELRGAGLRLDARDTFIAGTALSFGLPLVTRNRRHFERVPGLIVEEF